MKITFIVFSAIAALALTAGWYRARTSQDVLQDIAKSHIDANVPDEKEFDGILMQSLAGYFSRSGKEKTEVRYELLRKGPTQTGIAYPKFYLWVEVINDGKVIKEGAVRVAAMEKVMFQITHFLTKEEIIANPDKIYQIFPQALCDKILEKAKQG